MAAFWNASKGAQLLRNHKDQCFGKVRPRTPLSLSLVLLQNLREGKVTCHEKSSSSDLLHHTDNMKLIGFRTTTNWSQQQVPASTSGAAASGGKRIVFKYNDEFYNDVNNFCDNFDGMRNRHSDARPAPTSQCRLTYRHIPGDWKNGTQISFLKTSALWQR